MLKNGKSTFEGKTIKINLKRKLIITGFKMGNRGTPFKVYLQMSHKSYQYF